MYRDCNNSFIKVYNFQSTLTEGEAATIDVEIQKLLQNAVHDLWNKLDFEYVINQVIILTKLTTKILQAACRLITS